MNRELAGYLRVQATIVAAFNFFIGGMIAALIYHKADFVPADIVSIAVDLTLTCILTFVITTPFMRASLRRDKTAGLITAKSSIARLLARLSRCPVLMCTILCLCTTLILFALTALIFALLGVTALPFYLYIVLKSVFCGALGAFVAGVVLYSGMCRV
jgi:hypothetical protein